MITIGSLFSGIGGFDLAFQRSGFHCSWQVEKDKACSQILKKHFPNVKRFNDVRDCGKHNLEPVDLICGGFPCQDLSIAGRREGLAGERSGLWFEFARIIDELEPQWVVIENVPGLLSSDKGRDFAVIIRSLAERGYGVCWRVLDAQYFGLAQRRKRVFIVGSFGNGRAAQVLFECEGMCGDIKAKRKAGEIAPTLFANGAGTSRTASAGSEAEFCIPVSNALTSHHGRNSEETFIPEISRPLANSRTIDHFDESQQTYIAWKESAGLGGRGFLGSEDRSFALSSYIQRVGVRRLTPTECERLQGFPDGWTANQKDSTRYRQLGNAVAVPVAEWIGKRIKQITQ